MDYIEILRTLVGFPTINDPAKGLRPTRECPEFLKSQLSQLNIEAKILEQNGFFSVLATVGTGRPITLLLAHFDVVPIGPNWKTDPFDLAIRSGKGFGRGTADDKGNVTALLMTAKTIAQRRLKGTVVFAFTGDEEIGGTNGAVTVRSSLEEQNQFPDYLITADGVGMQIITRRRNTCGITISVPQKTRILQGTPKKHRFTTEYFGRHSRHSAYFLPGVDRHALLAASSFLLHHSDFKVSKIAGSYVKSNVVPDWVEIECINPATHLESDEHLSDLNLTKLIQALLPISRIQFPTQKSDFGITICPNLLYEKKNQWEVFFDGRVMTTQTEELKTALDEVLAEKLAGIKYQKTIRMGKAYMNTPSDSKLVKTAQKVASKLAQKTQLIELGGASDTRHFTDRPIDAIDFGPIGFGVHGSNEYVLIDSISQTARFYTQLVSTLHKSKLT